MKYDKMEICTIFNLRLNASLMRLDLFAFCFPLIILFSCGNIQEQSAPINAEEALEDRLTQVAPESVGLLKGTIAPLFDPYSCDANFIYDKVEICSNEHEEYNGNILTILNIADRSYFKIGEVSGCFFKGLVSNHLLVDTGTGTNRILEIYDLKGNKVKEFGYINDLKLEGPNIVFWQMVDKDELEEEPECIENWDRGIDNLGFVAENILDLASLTTKQTGRIDCQFME